MVKTISITATVTFTTEVEGETMDEIREKAQDILENEPLANFDWEYGEYKILDDEEVE